MVFGEGVLNDAVSIVIYNIKEHLIGNFLLILGGSLGIGLLGGAAGGFFFKKYHLDATQKEMAFVILLNYMVYLLAELLNVSGIMALFVSGISMRLYVFDNLS